VTTREPRYTDLDRAELLALALYRDGLCPLHGGPLADCDFDERGNVPDVLVNSRYCQAEVSRIEAINAATDPKKPNPYAGARMWATTIRKG
jgi:hypothetical protein